MTSTSSQTSWPWQWNENTVVYTIDICVYTHNIENKKEKQNMLQRLKVKRCWWDVLYGKFAEVTWKNNQNRQKVTKEKSLWGFIYGVILFIWKLSFGSMCTCIWWYLKVWVLGSLQLQHWMLISLFTTEDYAPIDACPWKYSIKGRTLKRSMGH